MRRLAFALLLVSAANTGAAAPPAGHYRLQGEPDVASEIILHTDGRFQYFLSAGALDEHAEGRWTREGSVIHLQTLPKPKPAVFNLAQSAKSSEYPLSVKVTWPDGRGIPSVDLRVIFDSGEPVTGYTQEYGWSLSGDERRVPKSLQLAVPMHGLVSQVFALDPATANALTFVLTPNDLGVVDFGSVPVTIAEDRLVMQRDGAALNYVARRR